ncbi:hypothetical protein [Staphylococcus xylosus]|uniref:hypothetical protein n=1 Tax=Staphylococcus xylosus TaxID=1288 RepID=UPI0011C8E9CC|nr:hypothetical protein [Staphylococcus xylosus]
MFDIESMNHIVNNLHPILGASDPGQWIDNSSDKAKEWGGKIATLFGVLCFIWGVWYIFGAAVFKSNKGKLVILAVVACLVGAGLTYGGISFLQSVGEGGFNGVKDIKN